MAYRNIMVHLDREPGAADRLGLAKDLAIRLGAVLTGAAAREPRTLMPSLNETVDEELIRAAEDEARVSMAAVERTFRDLAGSGPESRFRSDCRPPAAFLAQQARSADLVVVGRRDKDKFDGRFGVDPGALVAALGRPLLVVPPGVKELSPKRALVAWKDTQESRRAVQDSLPLLKQAQAVLVLTVSEDMPGAQGADDVVEYLHWHGVDAQARSETTLDASVSQTILEATAAEEADLIVAGSHGCSRFREWLFGGVTRELLARTPACCLLSH